MIVPIFKNTAAYVRVMTDRDELFKAARKKEHNLKYAVLTLMLSLILFFRKFFGGRRRKLRRIRIRIRRRALKEQVSKQ